jgi:hypothetical protein
MEIVDKPVKRNILILSFFMPPCNKVGGRRWAKFAKYLERNGFNVFVIGVKVPFAGSCPWEEDIRGYHKDITLLPYIVKKPFYHRVMRPTNLQGKLHYRVSKLIHDFRKRNFKGNYLDISKDYRSLLIEKAKELIVQKSITDLVVTGGPFYWLYFGTLLKKSYPQLKVLTDFRDYWTGGETYSELDEKARRCEAEKEREIIELADIVTTPAERISNYLRTTYKSNAYKVNIVPHGFDPEEFPEIKKEMSLDGSIHFIYGGILYEKMELAVRQLAELMSKLIAVGYKVHADIYTFDEKYRNLFEEYNVAHAVRYHRPLQAKAYFLKCAEADFLLQLRAGEANEQHFKSTKFYELLALKKFILYFGPAGEISDYLYNNGVGFSYNEDADSLVSRIISAKKGNLKLNDNLSIEEFNYENLTADLIKLLGK